MRITAKGAVTIPAAMRQKHGLTECAEVDVVDQPNGVLVARVAPASTGKRVLATLLHGGKVKGTTAELLGLTRGE